MKKSGFLLFILTSLFAFHSSSFSQDVSYGDTWGEHGMTLVSQTQDRLVINHSLESFFLADVEVNGGLHKAVHTQGVLLPNDAGAPDLPGFSRYITLPQGAHASVKILSSRTVLMQNMHIAPAPVIPADIDNTPLQYEKNMDIYGTDAFYPQNPVILSEPLKIRGVDVVMIGITPFQYNPVTGELIVYRDMEIEVVIEGGNGKVGEDRLRSRWWDPIVKGSVLNPDAIPELPAQIAPTASRTADYEYIIITPDNTDFINWANTIKDWRVKQGIRTGVVTTTEIGGNTVSAIETYVNNAYNTWNIPPVAVLLLGDYSTGSTGITSYFYPHPYYYSDDFPSDNYFADVDNDELPDIIFSRITARNATELDIMISKFMNYENAPPTNPGFYNNPITALGWQTERWFQICSETIGGYFKNVQGKTPIRINEIYSGTPGSTWSTATNTSTVVNYFGPNGLGYIPATPDVLGNWSGGTATDINNAINSGAFILQHRDHGNINVWGEPYYTTSNINGLTNTDLTFVFSINCLTGGYHFSTECMAEKFHRYSYNGQPSGALGVIAPTEVSYSFVNDTYTWGMYDNMFPDFMPDYGTVFPTDFAMPGFAQASGKYFLYQSSWPYNYGDKTITYRLFHHHGDPFMVLYSEVPQTLAVSHATSLTSSETSFTVTADAGSTIALTVNGEILAVETGTGAPLAIVIPSQPAGQVMIVTVTKQNYYRYSSNVDIVAGSGVLANFSGSPTSLCAGEGVTFTDASSGSVTSWNWTFNGGTPATYSGQTPPVIYYNSAGTFTVELMVSDGTNSDTETKTGYINVNPLVADFSGNPTTLVFGGSVTFTDLSTCNPNGWTWTFEGGDPATYYGQTPPPVYYYTPGSYDVTLQVNNASGTVTKYMPDYIIVTDIQYCSSSGNASQEWIGSIDIGGQVNSSGASSSGYSDFTALVFNLEGGNSYSVVAAPGFAKAPKWEFWKMWIDFNHDGDFLDSGEEVFRADKQRGTVIGNITIPAGVTGSTRMRVSMKRDATPSPCEVFSYGEVEDYTVSFTTLPPPLPVADFSANPTTVMEGESVQFTDISTGAPTTYSWSFPGGTPSTSTLQNPSVTYSIFGTYDVTLTVTNESGSDSETKTAYITVNTYVPPPAPVADFIGSPTSLNEGGAVQFTDLSTGSPTSYSWTFEGGTPSTSTLQNPSVTYATAGTYDVSLTVSNASGTDSEIKTGYITVTTAPPSSYCEPVAVNNAADWINAVTIGSNTNNSGQGATGFIYYTTPVFYFLPGQTYNVSMMPQNAKNRNFWRVWIDFNGDGDFDDSDETLLAANNIKGTVTGTITIPSYASTSTRMRVTMKTGNSPGSCDDYFDGEVEDYNVNLTGEFAQPVNDAGNLTVILYPNPVSEQLNIRVSGNSGPVQVRLYSAQGSVIREYEMENPTDWIQVIGLTSGLYFVHVTDGIQNSLNKVIVR